MTTVTAVPETAPVSLAEAPRAIGPAPKPREIGRPWWAHLAWVLGASIVGFAIPALFASGLHVSRVVFVLPYVCISAVFVYLYVRWSGVDVYARLRQHWVWGVLGAIVAGAFVVSNVLNQPASAAPSGLNLVGAILWLGVVYGTTDALLLSVLPLFATWQALSGLGWTCRWYGRLASGALALIASLVVAAAYHLGFPEFRGSSVGAPIIGNGVMSLASLLTMSPIAAIGAHVAMHVAAALHGAETTLQLPPHY
jgi:hypothetical protein